VGRKFIIKGIVYKEMGEWTIALRGDRVWAGENSTSITQDGYLLLREAADIVKELYTRQLRVEVYSRNEELSRSRGQIIMNYLLNKLVVPRFTVTHVSGFVDKVYKSSSIKIIL
jgi:outer membrane protein OmpA-like peptidoglycan-associated protein